MRIFWTAIWGGAIAGAAWAQATVETFGRRDSLAAGSEKSLYDQPTGKVYSKHDHIRIVVQERAQASAAANINTDKRSRTEIELEEWPRLAENDQGGLPELRAAALTGDPAIDLDARYRQEHKARTSRDFDLTFTIMAEVVDVRPNGNVVIEAKKIRTIGEEEEVLRITGEISPAFIVNNSVRSDDIFNGRVSIDGKGIISDNVDQGLFGWIVSKVWPF